MDKKKIGIALIIIGAIIIIIIIYWLFFITRKAVNPPAPVVPQTPPAVEKNLTPDVKTGKEIITITPNFSATNTPLSVEVKKETMGQIATSFAERLGSYSNQSNFSNIEDLTVYMDDNMQKWAQNYVNENRVKGTNADVYYGIITKGVTYNIDEYDEGAGKAQITVQTRRKELKDSIDNASDQYNENVVINFNKEGGIWKITAAKWQGHQ